jgi:hypothetical protein
VDQETGEFQGIVGGVGPTPEGIAITDQGVWVTSAAEVEGDPGTVTFVCPDDFP